MKTIHTLDAPTRKPVTTVADLSKPQILGMLDSFIRQRPGLEFGNYGDVKSYRAELRRIGKDLSHARTLLRAVECRKSITADDLRAGFYAYSGRLTLTDGKKGPTLDYCTGQYFPTEYRRAVCAVLSSVLWSYWRENAPVDAGPTERHSNLQNVGDYIRNTARREFGRSIASYWFN
jgi:hypothetical protein